MVFNMFLFILSTGRSEGQNPLWGILPVFSPSNESVMWRLNVTNMTSKHHTLLQPPPSRSSTSLHLHLCTCFCFTESHSHWACANSSWWWWWCHWQCFHPEVQTKVLWCDWRSLQVVDASLLRWTSSSFLLLFFLVKTWYPHYPQCRSSDSLGRWCVLW